MEKLITRIVAIAGVIAMAFHGVDYIREVPATANAAVEERLEKEISEVRREVVQRRIEHDAAMQKVEERLSAKLDQITKIMIDRLDKLEDRLYEMQRLQQLNSQRTDGPYDGG